MVSHAQDDGPFFHGTKTRLLVDGLATPQHHSNYQADLVMRHVYFTALIDVAGLAAELAAGDGEPHVYQVEPTGPFDDDPNVTDKRFPGNPTRSYRTTAPLRIIAELADWPRLTPEQLADWRERLAAIDVDGQATIIN